MVAKTVTFTSQKGGSGKSTSLMTIAASLSGRGYRVLVGDTDEQQTAFRWANCADTPHPSTVISLAGIGDEIFNEVSRQTKAQFNDSVGATGRMPLIAWKFTWPSRCGGYRCEKKKLPTRSREFSRDSYPQQAARLTVQRS